MWLKSFEVAGCKVTGCEELEKNKEVFLSDSSQQFAYVFALLRKGALKKNFLRRNIDIKKGSPQIQIKSHIYNVIRDD